MTMHIGQFAFFSFDCNKNYVDLMANWVNDFSLGNLKRITALKFPSITVPLWLIILILVNQII